jgi:exodeoxyribonuclease V alpha subunit
VGTGRALAPWSGAGDLAAHPRGARRPGAGPLAAAPGPAPPTEVGAAAGSAAWLAFQHGWRWADGAWTRLTVGQADPATGALYAGPEVAAALRPADLLVVDEAGMLDQDTGRALLTIADEAQARVALVGDHRQLAAVGRGGVLDLAVRAAEPAACLSLDAVYRFTRTNAAGRTVPDTEYAELTLAMRRGDDPRAVFDALHAYGQIRIHSDPPPGSRRWPRSPPPLLPAGERWPWWSTPVRRRPSSALPSGTGW